MRLTLEESDLDTVKVSLIKINNSRKDSLITIDVYMNLINPFGLNELKSLEFKFCQLKSNDSEFVKEFKSKKSMIEMSLRDFLNYHLNLTHKNLESVNTILFNVKFNPVWSEDFIDGGNITQGR